MSEGLTWHYPGRIRVIDHFELPRTLFTLLPPGNTHSYDTGTQAFQLYVGRGVQGDPGTPCKFVAAKNGQNRHPLDGTLLNSTLCLSIMWVPLINELFRGYQIWVPLSKTEYRYLN